MERAYFSYFSFFLLYTTIHTFILFLLLPPRDLAGQQGELACYMRQIHSAVERTDAPLLVVLLFFFFLFLIPASAAGDRCLGCCCRTAQQRIFCFFFRGHCSHMEVISAAFDDGENKRHLMSMRRKARKAVDRLLYPPTVDLLLLVLLLLLSFFLASSHAGGTLCCCKKKKKKFTTTPGATPGNGHAPPSCLAMFVAEQRRIYRRYLARKPILLLLFPWLSIHQFIRRSLSSCTVLMSLKNGACFDYLHKVGCNVTLA